MEYDVLPYHGIAIVRCRVAFEEKAFLVGGSSQLSCIYRLIAPMTRHTIIEQLTQLIFSEELFSSWHPFNITVELEEPILKRLNIHFSRLVWFT
jgi:hypothetical protein